MKSHITRVLCLAGLLPALLSGCDFSADDLEQVYAVGDADGDGVLSNLDCAPDDPTVYPGADDPWGDDIDQDCDGGDGIDLDGDGAPAEGFGTPAEVVDCDDFDAAINPSADEECDEVDSDCDGSLVDEDTDLDADGLPDCVDSDVDGDGADADSDCDDNDAALNLADADEDGETSCDGDCDDEDATVSSQGVELCDGQDNDCDTEIDEGLPSDGVVYYADADGDGHGDPSSTLAACAQPDGYLSTAGDCDDTDASLNQDDADSDGETTCDGDCDDSDADLNDADGDGDGESTCAGDCDDDNATLNNLDSDGDGYVTCIIEASTSAGDDDDSAGDDDDSAGDDDDSAAADPGPAGGDCNDADSAIYPGAVEACDLTDSDCDGSVVDEDLDTDGDLEPDCTDSDDDGDNHLDVVDCATTDPLIYPLADEFCDGVDNNCDGTIDEASALDATLWYADLDGDSHAGSVLTQLGCAAPSGFLASFDDCDDLDASSYPQGTEICDGSDNDCNLLVDDNAADATNWYADTDDDGYGDDSGAIGTVTTACDAPIGSVADSTDCDDGDPAISPAATDVPGDGVDNDCDGADAPLGTFLGDLTLTTDAGLTFFCSQYEALYGSLTVQGSSVTDLTDLSCLREIYGSLVIESTSVVTASLPNLSLIQGSFTLLSNWQLTNFSVPALTSTQDFHIDGNMVLEELSADALTEVEQLSLAYRADTLSMPLLATAGDVYLEFSAPATTSLSLPALTQVDDLYVLNSQSLDTIDLPQLAQARSITLQDNSALSTFSLPALTTLAAPPISGGDDDDDDTAGDDDDTAGDDDDTAGDDDDTAGDDDDTAGDDDDATVNDCLNLPAVDWLDTGSHQNTHYEAASGCSPTSTANLGDIVVNENALLTTIELPSLTAVGLVRLRENGSLTTISAASLAEVVTLRVQWGNQALTSFAGLTGLTRLGDLTFSNTALTDLSHLAAASASGCELYAEDNENLSNADFVALRDALDPSQAMGVALYYNGNGLDGDGDGVLAEYDCNDADGSEGEAGSWYWGPVDGDGDGVPRQYCSAGYGCLDSGSTPPATATRSTSGWPNDDCGDGDPAIKPGAVDICYDGINQNCSDLIDDGVDGDGDGVPNCYDCDDTDQNIGALDGQTPSCPAYSCLTLEHAAQKGWLPTYEPNQEYEIDPEGTGKFQVVCGQDGWTRVGVGLRSSLISEHIAWNSDAALNLSMSAGNFHDGTFHLSADQVNAILRGGITGDATSIRDMWANCADSRGPGTDRYWRGVGTYRWSTFTATDSSEPTCYYESCGPHESDCSNGFEAEATTWAPNHHYGVVCLGNMITSHNLYPGIAYPWYCDSSHNVDIEVWAR